MMIITINNDNENDNGNNNTVSCASPIENYLRNRIARIRYYDASPVVVVAADIRPYTPAVTRAQRDSV